MRILALALLVASACSTGPPAAAREEPAPAAMGPRARTRPYGGREVDLSRARFEASPARSRRRARGWT